jgi:hypothetical protein
MTKLLKDPSYLFWTKYEKKWNAFDNTFFVAKYVSKIDIFIVSFPAIDFSKSETKSIFLSSHEYWLKKFLLFLFKSLHYNWEMICVIQWILIKKEYREKMGLDRS